jgi:hypothetical protein
MADKFELKALITAVDKLSPVLNAQMKSLKAWKRQLNAAGQGGLQLAAGLAGVLGYQARAFAQVEDAATGLKNTLMDKNGLAGGFEQINKIALSLGNQLPGTTADFMSMASTLKALGVSTDSLAGGALEATAYLSVVGKNMGVTYESAAQAVGKLGNAFGIAAGDLIPFADTLQRTLHMGIDLEQMQYAMARVSGPLKALGKQGLGVANDLVPLVALLIQSGVSGEQAGTGIGKMVSVLAMQGKFTNVQNMVKDLEKMNRLAADKKLQAFKNLFGEEHAGKAAIIAAGGYTQLVNKMAEQASLQQRINNSLGTLTNLWEAAAGTFTNAMAAFGEVYAPQLRQLAGAINDVSSGLMDWAKNNGTTIKLLVEFAAAFVGMKVACLAAAGAVTVLNAALNKNIWMFLVQGLLIAAPLIYSNFDKIVEWVSYRIEDMANAMKAFKDMFTFNLFDGNGSSMRPPGSPSRSGFLTPQRVGGSIDVNFNNAPAGMRVAPATSGPVAVNPNVGYRTIGTGLP